MLSGLYSKWMYSWETALSTRDTNRIIRPFEWGFDWLSDFDPNLKQIETSNDIQSMVSANRDIVTRSNEFFGYITPTDFRLEMRHPQLFPTNVRDETLAQDSEAKLQAATGEMEQAEFLRFTSPLRTRYRENDEVNARWYPAPLKKQGKKPKQAIIVLPQWNADAFSHNALCTLFSRFGISALRLSKPYHDIRRPPELERSDYAVSANIGRTTSACRQAVVDILSCLDWLESQGYEQFGILGTSLGSCYAFIAAAHDPRLKICAFNHASTWFGDVVWTGQSTRHIRTAFEQVGLTQSIVRELFTGISPMSYMERFAQSPKRVLVVHATYDLTFRREFSLEVLSSFDKYKVDYLSRVLPCGHYTTGESPYKYIDGWYLGHFIYESFKELAKQPTKSF